MVTLSCPVPDELAGSWRRAPRSFNHVSSSLLDGQLRFMPPTGTLEKWDGVRVALRHRPVCPQPAAPSADKLRGDGVPLGHGVPLGRGAPLGHGVPLGRGVPLGHGVPLGRVEHLRRLAAYVGRQAEECLSLNVYVPVTGRLIIRRSGHGLATFFCHEFF